MEREAHYGRKVLAQHTSLKSVFLGGLQVGIQNQNKRKGQVSDINPNCIWSCPMRALYKKEDLALKDQDSKFLAISQFFHYSVSWQSPPTSYILRSSASAAIDASAASSPGYFH